MRNALREIEEFIHVCLNDAFMIAAVVMTIYVIATGGCAKKLPAPGAGGEFIPASAALGKAMARQEQASDVLPKISTRGQASATHLFTAIRAVAGLGRDLITIERSHGVLVETIKMRDEAVQQYAKWHSELQRTSAIEVATWKQKHEDLSNRFWTPRLVRWLLAFFFAAIGFVISVVIFRNSRYGRIAIGALKFICRRT
jgi:hypothetical protein